MQSLWVRVWLYAAGLTTGAAFCILFSGDTTDVFVAGSPAQALGAFAVMFGAALLAVLVGSAGRWRFVLIFPTAAVYTLIVVYGWPPLFSLDGWRELFWRIGVDALDGANTMYAQPIPYDLSPGLLIALIPIIMIVVAFAMSATLYEESPIFSVAVLGVTIGVLSTISFEDGAGPFFVVFLFCAIALLLFAGAEGSEDCGAGRTSPKLAWPSIVAGLAVAMVVLVLPKAPLADQTVSEGAIDWTRIGAGSTSNLNVQADVGDYLTVGRDVPVMRVWSEEKLLWRGGTLDYFDGVRWSDTTAAGEDDGQEVAPEIETDSVNQRVEVLNANTDLFFGAYRITNVSVPTAEQSSDSSWRMNRRLGEGDIYTVNSEIPQPTAEQLRSAGDNYPPNVRKKFLQIPNNNPPAVADTARKIEKRYGPAATRYDKARNIERYLQYDGDFTYNLDVNYRRADKAIEEFLAGDKEGFCTQFATSMALLAREEGIPSRVVYGATTGDEVGENEYLVKGGNMHTWVELFFPGVGWYTFDPTPGFGVPTTMEQNAPSPTVAASPNSRLGPENLARNGSDQPNEKQKPNKPDTPDEQKKKSPPAGGDEGGLPLWPLYALLPMLLVAAIPATKRVLASRGRPEDLYRDLTGRLRDLSGSAVADSPALTPNERMLLLAGAVGVDEAPFREFGRAYTDHLYSGASRRSGRRQVSSAYRRSVRALEDLPRWRQVLGAINPASLMARAKGSFAGFVGLAAKKLGGLRRS